MATSKKRPIKYADKSAGQEKLIPIFDHIKNRIARYATGHYMVRSDEPGNYAVFFEGQVEVQGRQYPDICFAAVLIQKGYVGFYFFPVYTWPPLKMKLPAELVKHLKGKSCFHIKEADAALWSALEETLETGYQFYVSKGWV